MKSLRTTDPLRIGRYRLLGRLGSGGMGRVYLGCSPAGRLVALKVIHPTYAEDPQFRTRFAHEVAAARRVSGFWTASVVDADPEGELPWLATAYVPGPSLEQAVEATGPLPESCVRVLAAALAEALAAIHEAGLVHRDVKPSNVLLASDGPRVIDFGISRALEGSALSRTGQVAGTPAFMSPEQAEAREEIGSASDVFSLGAVLVFATTGTGPFGEGSMPVVMHRVVYETPNVAAVPEGLRALVTECLAKDPAARPTPAQLVEWLEVDPALLAGEEWLPEAVLPLVHEAAAVARRLPPADRQTQSGQETDLSGKAGSVPATQPSRLVLVPDELDQQATQSRKQVAGALGVLGATASAGPPAVDELSTVVPGQSLPGQSLPGQSLPGQTRQNAEPWRGAAWNHPAPLVNGYPPGGVQAPAAAEGQDRQGNGPNRRALLLVGAASLAAAGVGGAAWLLGGSEDQAGTVRPAGTNAAKAGTVRWSVATGGKVDSTPVLVGKTLYVGSGDKNIHAIDTATGKHVWQQPTGGVVRSTPAVTGGVVYVGSNDGRVYALDAATGKPRWTYQTGGYVWSSPAVADGVVYVGSNDGRFYALDAATGKLRWAPFQTGGEIWAPPLVADGVAYIGSLDHRLYALDAASGDVRWSFAAGHWIKTLPTIVGDTIYFGSCDTYVYALQLADQKVRWKFKTGDMIHSSPKINGSTVYVGGYDRNIYAISASDGRQRWKRETGQHVTSTPWVAGSTVYIGSNDGSVYALDAADGDDRWTYKTGGSIDWSSPVIADNTLYIGSGDNSLYALATG